MGVSPSSIVMSWLVAFWLLSFIMAQIHNVEVSGYPTDGQDHMCTDEGGLILCPGHLSPGYHLSTHSLAHGNGDLHTGHLTPESGHGIGPGRFRSMKKMKMALVVCTILYISIPKNTATTWDFSILSALGKSLKPTPRTSTQHKLFCFKKRL